MTENSAEKDKVNAKAKPDDNKTGVTYTPVISGILKNNLVSVVLVVVVIIVGVFLYREIRDVRKVSELQSGQATAQIRLINNRIKSLEDNFSELSSQYYELGKTVTDLDRQQPSGNEDWALSETEYLLIIATHRLQLENDVDTALAAMEAALLRIEALADPDLVPVREQFVSDINNLKAVNRVDITGLSIYLADLIERADKLPLDKNTLVPEKPGNKDTALVEDTTSGWKDLTGLIWREIKSLVVIKKSGDVKRELLLPDQEYFLYQNLRLELESARNSVLRRDTENLHTSVSLILEWLDQYYDTNDSAVINIQETLEKMSTINLDPELPDINSSLETLRAYIHSKETAQLFQLTDNRVVFT